jgi:hypothetical protein
VHGIDEHRARHSRAGPPSAIRGPWCVGAGVALKAHVGFAVPDVTQSVYPALKYVDTTREWRTGVTRQGQGIDAKALQKRPQSNADADDPAAADDAALADA